MPVMTYPWHFLISLMNMDIAFFLPSFHSFKITPEVLVVVWNDLSFLRV